jgi:hypothetical protein
MLRRSSGPPSTAKRRAKSATGSLLSLYDGTILVGTIRVGIRGDAVAYGPTGKRIGAFASAEDAKAAFK